MRRISILGLMGVVVAAGLGLAALRDANELWAGLVLLADLAAVGTALLGVVYRRGRERAWWLGFALFGGGYLALTTAPVLADYALPNLGTTRLLDDVHTRVTRLPVPEPPNLQALRQLRLGILNSLQGARQIARGQNDPSVAVIRQQIALLDARIAEGEDLVVASATATPVNRWRTWLPGARNYEPFQRVGHGLFTILAGLLGGATAVRFQARREPPERVEAPGDSAGGRSLSEQAR